MQQFLNILSQSNFIEFNPLTFVKLVFIHLFWDLNVMTLVVLIENGQWIFIFQHALHETGLEE